VLLRDPKIFDGAHGFFLESWNKLSPN